jgi:hypothetical protein
MNPSPTMVYNDSSTRSFQPLRSAQGGIGTPSWCNLCQENNRRGTMYARNVSSSTSHG